MTRATTRPLGARWQDDGHTSFLVWAPEAETVEVVLADPRGEADAEPQHAVAMQGAGGGYHHALVPDVPPGTTYRYRLHRREGPAIDRPDPASRWQPQGVHGPSAVDDPRHEWGDAGFAPRPLHEQVLYELHVGTFSPAGTFDGVAAQLPRLADLGVTAIELMPVAQFPGARNWGYDGVLPYAVQDSYGGPAELRRLVDAAHAHDLAVILDVVYNHLGPEGNHLADFGPYFTDRTSTPWGPALNADGPGGDAVRRYVVENAVRWVREFHVDGLRLDAVHAIHDQSAVHLLEQLGRAVHDEADRRGAPVHVIAESDLCDARLLRHPEAGGLGLDAQWADDFHHAVHVALTTERDGYYADYRGLEDVPDQLRDRYVYAGRWSPSRERTVGRAAPDVPYDRFVACVQNHDQVGNRAHGERLTDLVDLEGRKLAAAALLTAPFVPMLFMGEEYGETAPFQYFTSHSDPDLAAAVTRGRREEFAAFADFDAEVPDPQATATFERSRIDPSLRGHGEHRVLHELYRRLLRLRATVPLLGDPRAPDVHARTVPGHQTLLLRRTDGRDALLVALNAAHVEVEARVEDAGGSWEVLLDTADERWGGPGAGKPPRVDDGVLHLTTRPRAALLLRREET